MGVSTGEWALEFVPTVFELDLTRIKLLDVYAVTGDGQILNGDLSESDPDPDRGDS